MHESASVRNAMSTNTVERHESSEQDTELRKSRLRNIATGIVARENDAVNCYDAEKVILTIREKQDDTSISIVSLRKNNQ
ncbi:hypothetical protein PR048_024810, partial [Dryococelus australis]